MDKSPRKCLKKITIIGTGNLGKSIANGLLEAAVVKPADLTLTKRNYKVLENYKKEAIVFSIVLLLFEYGAYRTLKRLFFRLLLTFIFTTNCGMLYIFCCMPLFLSYHFSIALIFFKFLYCNSPK